MNDIESEDEVLEIEQENHEFDIDLHEDATEETTRDANTKEEMTKDEQIRLQRVEKCKFSDWFDIHRLFFRKFTIFLNAFYNPDANQSLVQYPAQNLILAQVQTPATTTTISTEDSLFATKTQWTLESIILC